MGATMETLDFLRPIPEMSFDPAHPVFLPVPMRKQASRRRKEERWASTLNPRDLRCLLAALEEQVIPTLIAEYSPADTAPLAHGDHKRS